MLRALVIVVALLGTAEAASNAKRPAELVELSHILTKGAGPTLDPARKIDVNLTTDPSWDPGRAWLLEYAQDGTKIQLTGECVGDGDVVQLVKRLALSVYFKDVTPISMERVRRKGTAVYKFVVRFESRVADPRTKPFKITKW
jgi:hypothetical protein